ncbi:MAG: hypothetical protein RL616_2176 [Verrucomicrobiota bacterium]
MKAKFFLLALGSSLLAAPALVAQIVSTNVVPLTETLKYQIALESERALGERALLPPGLKEKMRLTDAQRSDFKPIEEEFAVASQEYQTANQPRIEAAQDAERLARSSKNPGKIQAARKQLQTVWGGLQPYRDAAVKQLKPLLTPEQLIVLEDASNQWRENHATEANDPSAN